MTLIAPRRASPTTLIALPDKVRHFIFEFVWTFDNVQKNSLKPESDIVKATAQCFKSRDISVSLYLSRIDLDIKLDSTLEKLHSHRRMTLLGTAWDS